jgi:hypothetical protein
VDKICLHHILLTAVDYYAYVMDVESKMLFAAFSFGCVNCGTMMDVVCCLYKILLKFLKIYIFF